MTENDKKDEKKEDITYTLKETMGSLCGLGSIPSLDLSNKKEEKKGELIAVYGDYRSIGKSDSDYPLIDLPLHWYGTFVGIGFGFNSEGLKKFVKETNATEKVGIQITVDDVAYNFTVDEFVELLKSKKLKK